MERVKRALEICAEIERLQTELKTILTELGNNDCQQCASTAMCDITDAPTMQEVEISSLECNNPLGKEFDTTDFVMQKPGTSDDNAQSSDLRKYFTLNDRFRFKRELFNGSDADFINTIDTISAMSSVDEVTDYLSTMGWDIKSDIVEEFLNIINSYFNGAYGLNRN